MPGTGCARQSEGKAASGQRSSNTGSALEMPERRAEGQPLWLAFGHRGHPKMYLAAIERTDRRKVRPPTDDRWPGWYCNGEGHPDDLRGDEITLLCKMTLRTV